MKLNRIMIAAPKSGSGKTTITCVLLQALRDSGKKAAAYKCGPDYIDPMFHKKVIGIPSGNLDTFFTDERTIGRLFTEGRTEDEFVVMEGVMGLYDGLGGIREEGSSYHLARVTKTPVILVVDAKGMGWSVIPLIAGFLKYDRAGLIRGVILNRISGSYYETIRRCIEEEMNIKVLGYFPDRMDIRVGSRHLGLVMPDELDGIREQLQRAAEQFVKTVSMESLMQIAESADEIQSVLERKNEKKRIEQIPVIAVARDEAFCFYYGENIRMLEEYGAEIRYFSPLHDEGLPGECQGLLLGGGYPELYLKELNSNITMRRAIKSVYDAGMPIVAECGGFMYLHEAILDENGARQRMVGIIPAVCTKQERLVRFGYIEMREKKSCFLPEGKTIRGHEFHYYDSSCNGTDCVAQKPVTGREYDCVIETDCSWMGFPHLYYPSNPEFAANFVKKAKAFGKRNT